MTSILEWAVGVWDWLLDAPGSRLGGGVLTMVVLGFANGARLDRRAESSKAVLAAEALELYEREISDAPEDAGVTVERHLRPDPLPRLAWEVWKRFRRRWFQRKHLPWRVRHHRCARLLWRRGQDFNVVLMSASAPSRREAVNEVLAQYNYRDLTAAEFEELDRPGAAIVLKLGDHGYLIVEPALPRWRRKPQHDTARPKPTPEPAEGAPQAASCDPSLYGSDNDAQGGSRQ